MLEFEKGKLLVSLSEELVVEEDTYLSQDTLRHE
jgi:hypothetical protein